MKENNVSRRDFVKTLGVVGVGSVVGAGQALAQSNAPPPPLLRLRPSNR